MKVTFLGAGSAVFARNILGDVMCTPALAESEIILYDIDAERLKESEAILGAINAGLGGKARIKTCLGVENRKAALRGADFVVNAIQVGGYDPCTITDFEIPKKYGIRQTIGDTLGIGGIMRGLRTIPVMADIAHDMEEVCPDAWFLNYTNPMAILSGYMQRYTGVKTVGLCHSVQVCSENLLKALGMESTLPGRVEKIAGINHQAWLLEISDRQGKDLYPEIRRRAAGKNHAALSGGQKHSDMVRFDYIEKLGYYCTESSEHNAEYTPWYIKSWQPELIAKFNIPLDEYPRRCLEQIAGWKEEYAALSSKKHLPHERSIEYGSRIMEAVVTGVSYKIGGNVLNSGGLIDNLPAEACVEVPCLVDAGGVMPCRVGPLPLHLAALNSTNINVQLLTIEAAHTHRREAVYHSAMMDPITAAALSLDGIVKMVDELLETHGKWLPEFV
jgi:alpha-galactosidase